MKKSRILFGVLVLVLLVFSTSSKGQAATCNPGQILTPCDCSPGQINTPCSSARGYAQGETATPLAVAPGQTDTPPSGELSLTEIASSVLLGIVSLF
jgi:hypothetical protein